MISSLVKDAKSPLFRLGYLSDVSWTGPRASRPLQVEKALLRELSLNKARCLDIAHDNFKGICFTRQDLILFIEIN